MSSVYNGDESNIGRFISPSLRKGSPSSFLTRLSADSSTQLAIDAIYDRMAKTENDMEEFKAESREFRRGVEERERKYDERFDDLKSIIFEMCNAFTASK
ncbi:hypothetical protein SCLCIDRAFT_1221750 [Scleroderma citrinum Foug A]|uniref:Uncharacterized protein n=1 Tax=Scleroderma citrinum Foug A TaxID=1036808 RepID=A0A0C3DED2_9AGAM|nr:hypothetical protein SCLCIDRAFT_1221750 [Scleroderma citrinum Foug A]